MRIGVFGSALNPMTLGHVDAISQVLDDFDLIYVVPSYQHAFNKSMLDFEVRCQIAEITIEHCFTDSKVKLSKVEQVIHKDGPVYTYDVLDELHHQHPNSEIVFLCGPDNMEIIDKFYRSQDILSRWSIQALAERKEIRSTYVRDRVATNQSIIGLVCDKAITRIKEEYKTA